jgi:hypothetical protein
MLDPDAETLLRRILDATKAGRLRWATEPDGYHSAPIGPAGESILIRRMFLEATNQVGADPYFVELSMPGWNARFAIVEDSDGWRLVRAILDAGLPHGWSSSPRRALDFFERHEPPLPPPSDSAD